MLKNVVILFSVLATPFLLLALPATVTAGPAGDEQVINMVEIVIEEESISIDISFNGSFEGQLNCKAVLLLNKGIIIESVDVFLELDYPEQISVALDDYEFTLTPENPVFEFNANVTVHPMTSSTLRPDIVIDGSCVAQPTGRRGGISEDRATVVVLPFYTAEISFLSNTATINKRDSKDVLLMVENRGNADEKYILNLANADELRKMDITIEFGEREILVKEGDTSEVQVTISTGKKTERGSYVVRIEVWSEKNGPANKEDSNAVLVIDVKDPLLKSIEEFFNISPSVFYITVAGVIISLLIGTYLILKWRADRAWKKRLRQYRSSADHFASDQDKERSSLMLEAINDEQER